MRRLVLMALACLAVPTLASAQTWGQPRYGNHGAAYIQPYGSAAPVYNGYGAGPGSAQPYGYGSVYGDPRAYRPPFHYGDDHDRGGRYGYSTRSGGDWSRWSSPPGRGYHDVYGYNDDRAPRGADYRRHVNRDCRCSGAYLYDR